MSWDGVTERRSVNLGVISVKLDNMHDDIIELKDRVKVQNGRIGKLENWRSYMLGGLALAVFIITLVVKTH